MKVLNKYLICCSILIIPSVVMAEEQALKMHFFDNDSAEVQKEQTHENELNMIIFDEPKASKNITKDTADHPNKSAKSELPFNYWTIGLSTGYQNESLEWQVASPIIRENWHSVDLWNLQADLKLQLPIGFLIKGRATYGFSFDGDLSRSSEFGNSQQAELTSGYAMEFSGAVGYEFLLGKKQNQSVWGSITPLVGYEYQEQEYKEINSRYKTEWQGPWIGLDMVLGIKEAHEVFINSSLHWVDFEGVGEQANYGYDHSADGYGYKAGIGYRFKPSENWSFSCAFQYQHWDTDSGIEALTLQSGSVVDSELTSVVRDTFGVNTSVEFHF